MAKRKAKSVPVVVPPADPLDVIERDTKAWTRTKADELAVAAGMMFDAERGQYVCDWIERNCYLYEGDQAGLPLTLMPYQREFVMRLFSWVQWSDHYNAYIRRFTRANLLVAKKNGKSPLLAAIGLYLTCADGERGQKVYMAAKTGKQAGIAQAHAIAMVEQSPNLKNPVCVINKSTGTITHADTRSKMQVLTGDDTRGAQQSEGINGSVLIDELHVFEREVHERTKGAGISRKEPINLAVSTAGDDPSSVGFERVEYGRAVNEGKRHDPHFLHVEYAAPQKATDVEIDEHIEEYAKAANPALGYTVRLEELIQDYESAKGKPREMARVKQYRLNLHVGSTFPWLDIGAWNACRRDYTPEVFRGRSVSLGIDLSRTRDMTAAVFNMKDEDDESAPRKIWPLFWLPRHVAEMRKNLFPYLEWAERGEITLTEGKVVDFGAVESDLVSFVEQYEILVDTIYFDQHFAEEFSQRVMMRLGCGRAAVSQTIMTLSPLCMELERAILGGFLEHPGNAVLDWQAGHVRIKTDRNRNIAPEKPDPNSGKSIDGIAALVNTYANVVEGLGEDTAPSLTFF